MIDIVSKIAGYGTVRSYCNTRASMSRGVYGPDVAVVVLVAAVILVFGVSGAFAVEDAAGREFAALRGAITDLVETFGAGYPDGAKYLAELEKIEAGAENGDKSARMKFVQLKRKALLANPLLDFDKLLVVKRGQRQSDYRGNIDPAWGFAKIHAERYTGIFKHGMPTNHECNSSMKRTGYDDQIAILSVSQPASELTTFYRPKDGGYVGEIDLHWGGDRMLFTQSDSVNWKVWEIMADGSGLRQVSQADDDVDCFDGCYRPDGKIIFGSTASYTAVPCWHGLKNVTNLYVMNADGSGMPEHYQ